MADWKTPENLKYTENDEWVLVEGGSAKIGLTDYAQDQLSDIVFVDVQVESGGKVTAGETFATVESVKAASDVFAPVSGSVLAVNEALNETPELINSDPYGAGWLIEVKLSDPSEANKLLDATGYAKHVAQREG